MKRCTSEDLAELEALDVTRAGIRWLLTGLTKYPQTPSLGRTRLALGYMADELTRSLKNRGPRRGEIGKTTHA